MHKERMGVVQTIGVWGPARGTCRGPEGDQRVLERSGTLMEELGGDQSLKERSEGVKEGKRCGLESSRAQTEGSGEYHILQLVLAAWLNSDFHCTGQNSHNISQHWFGILLLTFFLI